MTPQLGEGVRIHPSARINVTERLVIGAYSTIHESVVIEGRDVEIGQEAWILPGAIIGGGSCFERQSSLRAGHFLHLGRETFINTARPVVLGNEVGLGTGTKLYTHGAYLSALNGFPVAFAPITLGDRVWLPGAVVNPGVTIGSDVVVGVGSVVTRNIPDGSLVGGVPAKVLRQGAYPNHDWDRRKAWWAEFWHDYPDQPPPDATWTGHGLYLVASDTMFDPDNQRIVGEVSDESERLRNQLRRYGIRFYSRPAGGVYVDWVDSDNRAGPLSVPQM